MIRSLGLKALHVIVHRTICMGAMQHSLYSLRAE
jgi:hypothetical protein